MIRTRWSCVSRSWLGGLLGTALLFGGTQGVVAEEPAANCPCAVAVGVPMLSRIPYLNRLFKNVPVAALEGADAQDCQRIGVDFEWGISAEPAFAPFAIGPAARVACFACADAPSSTTASKSCAKEGGKACDHACDPACDDACDKACEKACEKACGKAAATCGKSGCCQTAKGREGHDLWNRVLEMAAERSAVESVFEARVAMYEGQMEMLSSLAELAAEKAKLEARLELQAEREAMFKQLVELSTKNAKLEAQLEMTQVQTAVMQEVLKLTLENEQLRTRVAELTPKSTTASEPVRVSSQPSGGPRRR